MQEDETGECGISETKEEERERTDKEMKNTERWMMIRKRRKRKNEIVGWKREKEGRTGETDGQVTEMVSRQNFSTARTNFVSRET